MNTIHHLRVDRHMPLAQVLGMAILLVLLSLFSARGFAADRPNILVILTDDQGWGDLSFNGNRNLDTPHIDTLARQGTAFDRFFVCPVCSPTRAEFLTGRYHPRSNVFSTSAGGERMNLDETTIADTFKAAGYATAAFGKWHNGMQYPYHPNGRGFDEYYGFCSGHWGEYFSPQLEHNGRLVKGDGFVIDDFTNYAIEFIEQHKDQPFFVYLPYNTPHSPMQVPDLWWDKFKDKDLALRNREPDKEDLGHTRAALAMCENIDWNVGRLLKKLDDLQLANNTIVVYFCDNGPNGVRWNGGMKGRKGSTDEGGVRSPMFVRWPGKIAAGKHVPHISAAIDLLPTLADLAGVPIIGQKPLDGLSLKPLLLEQADQWPDRSIFSHWNKKISVRTQQYRLDHQGHLFDMQADPGQTIDVARQHPQIASRLRSQADDWQKELLTGLTDVERPFLLGHTEFGYTQIPARDGSPHGNIRRSNKFPNCSYFTNWTSTDDKITWPVEVAATGDYEVEVYYTCPQADVGATIELSLEGNRIAGTVNMPHDPPLVGAAHDRVPRTESYVKDFVPLKLGTLHLEAGRGELTLRATDIPGSQAMDFRLLMFTKISE